MKYYGSGVAIGVSKSDMHYRLYYSRMLLAALERSVEVSVYGA